jgi:acyl carrier protein
MFFKDKERNENDPFETLVAVLGEEWPQLVVSEHISRHTEIFYSGIGLDSVDGITLVILLEEHFDLNLDKDQIPMGVFETMGSLSDFIAAQLRAKAT